MKERQEREYIRSQVPLCHIIREEIFLLIFQNIAKYIKYPELNRGKFSVV